MTIAITAAIAGMASAALFLLKTRTQDSGQLHNPRPQIPTMGVQIVCGNCSGDNLIAVKTFLDHEGNCEVCGGHSFVLASALASSMLQQRALRAVEAAVAAGGGRVIPFDPAARSVRSEKVAV
jgi:hypothetical protein